MERGMSTRIRQKVCLYLYGCVWKAQEHYANDLPELRRQEQALMKDKLDGIDSAKAHNMTLDGMFERYIATKYDLRPNTFHTYKYLYRHYVSDTRGKMKLAQLRYADMVHFYFYLIEE